MYFKRVFGFSTRSFHFHFVSHFQGNIPRLNLGFTNKALGNYAYSGSTANMEEGGSGTRQKNYPLTRPPGSSVGNFSGVSQNAPSSMCVDINFAKSVSELFII